MDLRWSPKQRTEMLDLLTQEQIAYICAYDDDDTLMTALEELKRAILAHNTVCGHTEWRGGRCAQMGCWNYTQRHRDDEAETPEGQE